MIIPYLSSEKHDEGLSLQEWIIFVLFHLKKNDDKEGKQTWFVQGLLWDPCSS